MRCICATGGCGSSIRFYDCNNSFQDLPISPDSRFGDHQIYVPHCGWYFEFLCCEGLDRLHPITPSTGLRFNNPNTDGFRINCGCLIELIPCQVQHHHGQQAPGVGNTVVQTSARESNRSTQAQGRPPAGRLDTHQNEVAGPSENGHTFTNGCHEVDRHGQPTDEQAATPGIFALDQDAPRTLVTISNSGNMGDNRLGLPTAISNNPMDIDIPPHSVGAMGEDQSASSVQDQYAATPVTEQVLTDSHAVGGGFRQRTSGFEGDSRTVTPLNP